MILMIGLIILFIIKKGGVVVKARLQNAVVVDIKRKIKNLQKKTIYHFT